MARTKIRKEQIRIEEFIQALNSVDWTSDVLTASAAAINQKILNEIANVAGAMLYRGAWSIASTDTIKKGYVYVYAGNSNGTIGTGLSQVTLEPGDMLIANRDSASITNPEHWTIVNMNITGAITEANLVTQLVAHLASSNTNLLSIAAGTGANAGKVLLTVNFPTISGGSAETGKYISSISINATTGVITVTKATLPNYHKRIVLGEVMTVVAESENKIWKTSNKLESLSRFSVYVNGVKQTLGDNGDATAAIDSDSKGKVTFANDAYIPQSGDTVLCDYVSVDEIN